MSTDESDLERITSPSVPPKTEPDPPTAKGLKKAESTSKRATPSQLLEERSREHIADVKTHGDLLWSQNLALSAEHKREFASLRQRLDDETRQLREHHEKDVDELRTQLDLEVKTYRSEYERLREASIMVGMVVLLGNVLIMIGGTMVSAAGYFVKWKTEILWAGIALCGSGIFISYFFTVVGLIRRVPPHHVKPLLNAARGGPTANRSNASG